MWRYLVACMSLVTLNPEGSLLPFENNHLNATVGGYAVMNCHLDFPFGHEIPYQLEWDKDGETIFSWYSAEGAAPRFADSFGGRIQQLRDGRFGLGRGSVNLTAVRETDNGLYHCRVIFPNRTPPTRNNGTFYYLEVEGGNLIVTPPVNVTCMEGERAEFECLPKSLESVVTWYKDGEPVADLMDLAHRTKFCDNGSLVIEHTVMTDPGEYECHVRNPDGELQSASAFLDVQYKAKVVYSPKERFLPYGKPARLDCHFSANPPLTNLRWEKDGFLFDSYNVPGVYYSRNGSLLFNQVDESHAGLYSCTPYNILGTEGASPAVRVRVLRPPRISPAPRPLYLARLGQPLTMVCGTEGNGESPPTITWSRKDGMPLPEGQYSLDGGNLTLEAVTEEDRGIYVCTARNDAATTTAVAELMIENVPPRAPYNLTAVATSDSIHVKWVPGYIGQNVEYNVWYRPRAQSEWHTMKILSLGITEATLLGLQPGAEYEVRVLAQDHLGDGLFSKPIFVRTAESEMRGEELPIYAAEAEEIDEPPREVTARAIAEGVLVTWEAGPTSRRCGVRWYSGPDAQLKGSTHTTHNYLLVTDVVEGEQYLFVVWCGGSPGASEEGVRVSLQVPAYSRLRTVAAAAGGAALVLAVIAAIIYFARDRICGLRDRFTEHKCRR